MPTVRLLPLRAARLESILQELPDNLLQLRDRAFMKPAVSWRLDYQPNNQ